LKTVFEDVKDVVKNEATDHADLAPTTNKDAV
jgi:hypothetical protein